MKSTGSGVTYLIFEYLCILHTVYENAGTVIFSRILNTGPHSCILGAQIQL